MLDVPVFLHQYSILQLEKAIRHVGNGGAASTYFVET
jgi:hypothetical protein